MRMRLWCFVLSLAMTQASAWGQENPPVPPGVEPVTPPVRVVPPEEDTALYEPMQPYESPYAFPGYARGTIPWDSNVITRDNQLVGPYGQPVWTTQRPFAGVRTYVLPPGTVQFEQWCRPTWPQVGKPEYRYLEEIAIGLPGRFQLDIYERWNVEQNEDNKSRANHEGVQIELRYALADWGVLPLNPTLYIEWIERGGRQDKADKYEFKLLGAEEVLPYVYYATNFVLEHETQDEHEVEVAWSNALATTVIDRKLMAGMETNLAQTTVTGARSQQDVVFTLGPTMQWRPTNRTYLTTTALFGTTPDSPLCQAYFIFGYQFGARSGPSRPGGPSSTIGN